MSIYVKSINFFYVHFILDTMKSWSLNLKFILKCSMFSNFFFISKSRLKNIFLKVLNDLLIWKEIEKMIDSGLISFDKNCIYRSFSYEHINSLSYFLFNVFFSEFDFYIFSSTIIVIKKIYFSFDILIYFWNIYF